MTAQPQPEQIADTAMATALTAALSAQRNGTADKSAKKDRPNAAAKAARPGLVLPPAELPTPTPAAAPVEQPEPTLTTAPAEQPSSTPTPAVQRYTGVFIAGPGENGAYGRKGWLERRNGEKFDQPSLRVIFALGDGSEFMTRGDEIVWLQMADERNGGQLISWTEFMRGKFRYATDVRLVDTPANKRVYTTIRSTDKRVGPFHILSVVYTQAGAEKPERIIPIHSTADIPEDVPASIRQELEQYYASFEADIALRDANADAFRTWLIEQGAKFHDVLTEDEGAYRFTIEGVTAPQHIGVKYNAKATQNWLRPRLEAAAKIAHLKELFDKEGVMYTVTYDEQGGVHLLKFDHTRLEFPVHGGTRVEAVHQKVMAQFPQGLTHAVTLLFRDHGVDETSPEATAIRDAERANDVNQVMRHGAQLVVQTILLADGESDYSEVYADFELLPWTIDPSKGSNKDETPDFVAINAMCANLDVAIRDKIEKAIATFHYYVRTHNQGYKPKQTATAAGK